jgi:hypothetical protein
MNAKKLTALNRAVSRQKTNFPSRNRTAPKYPTLVLLALLTVNHEHAHAWLLPRYFLHPRLRHHRFLGRGDARRTFLPLRVCHRLLDVVRDVLAVAALQTHQVASPGRYGRPTAPKAVFILVYKWSGSNCLPFNRMVPDC